MCVTCWIGEGSPKVDNEKVRNAAQLIAEVYEDSGEDSATGGNLHYIIEDWNAGDYAINGFRGHGADADFTKSEEACLAALERMSEEERFSALALEEGLWGKTAEGSNAHKIR